MAASYRNHFGFWVGGLSGAAFPPVPPAGYRALFGFWLGGFAGESGEVEPPEPTVPPPGGGEPGRGAKGGRKRRRIKDLADLPEQFRDEFPELFPPPVPRIKLNRAERKLVQLQARARSQDEAVAGPARARLEALAGAPDSPLARLIARQQALDEIRRLRALAAAGDDEAVMAMMRWLMSNP